MVRKLASALLSALVALAFAAGAQAQTGPAGQPGAVNQPGTVNPLPSLAMNGLSEADLLNVLRGLDPNVKEKPIKDGTEYYLSVQRDGWKYDLKITAFAREIWVDTFLGQPIGSVQQVPALYLAQLLEANFDSASFFGFIKQKDGKDQLVLSRLLDRCSLTVDRLNDVIKGFCEKVKTTYPTWNAIITVK
jgi:hypothetical protein